MRIVDAYPVLKFFPPPPSKCPLCATEHGPTSAHDATSLHYMMRFRLAHGRDATWADAIAHCPQRIRKLWRRSLVTAKRWSEPPSGIKPIAEPVEADVTKPENHAP